MFFHHVEEVKLKIYCKNIAAMLSKQWKRCFLAKMVWIILCRCQIRHLRSRWSRLFHRSFHLQCSVRQPPIATHCSNSSSSSNTQNDFWPHRTQALDICRRLSSQKMSSRTTMEIQSDAAVPANRKNDTNNCSKCTTTLMEWDIEAMFYD